MNTSWAFNSDVENFAERRERMVREQLVVRGIRDPRVLAAMNRVPTEEFVPRHYQSEGYEDWPLIGKHGWPDASPS